MHTAFRPWFGRALTVLIGVTCTIGLVITVVADGWGATWRFGPWIVLFAGAVWALYWQPVIEIGDRGVRVVNIIRTIDIPWPQLSAVDTVWSLRFVTSAGRFAAWAAPAPSAVASMRQARRQQGVMRRSVDRIVTDPAADRSARRTLQALTEEIQRAWDNSRSGGASVAGAAEGTVRVHWHRPVILVGAVLLALAVLSLFTS